MQVKQTVGVSGEFSIRVLREDGSVKTELPSQQNLVTDNGLRLLSFNKRTSVHGVTDQNNDIIYDLGIGIGSGTPANNDVAFFDFLKFADEKIELSANLEQPTDSRPHFVKTSYSKRFIFKNINNQNISELGLCYRTYRNNDTDYVLYTHALIKNTQGTPTAITVLSGEILEVTYTFNMYYDIRQQSGTFTLKTLANTGDVEKEETYNYRLQHYAHNASFVTYGFDQSFPYPTAWAAKEEVGFDFATFPEASKSLSSSEMEELLKTVAKGGYYDRAKSGNSQYNASEWRITDGTTLVEILDRSANSQRIRITTSPYIQNFETGIRVITWYNSYGRSNKFSSALVVAEQESGKGIMKTDEHKLSFEVVTTHSRYEGTP